MATSIRVGAKARLVALLAEHPALTAAKVSFGFPDEFDNDECVWVGETTGAVSVATMRAGRKTLDDEFDIGVHFMAATPGQSAEQAEQRVEDMYGALVDILADDPTLGGFLNGASAAWQNGGTVRIDSELAGEGHRGYADASVHVKARLT